MFNNNVFKPNVDTVEWIKGAMTRSLKTFAQTMGSMLTVGQAFTEVNWKYVCSVALVASIYSILMSIAGIPEVKESEE